MPEEQINQIAEFQRKWTEQQQQLLRNWFDTLQGASGGTLPNTWRQAIDTMERQVNNTLDAQKRSLMALSGNARDVEGVPEPLTQWLCQLEKGIALWNEVQQRLWQVWFDMLRAAVPAPQNPGEVLAGNWEKMMQSALSLQEQWLTDMAGWQTAFSKNSGGKSAKPSPSKRSSRTR